MSWILAVGQVHQLLLVALPIVTISIEASVMELVIMEYYSGIEPYRQPLQVRRGLEKQVQGLPLK